MGAVVGLVAEERRCELCTCGRAEGGEWGGAKSCCARISPDIYAAESLVGKGMIERSLRMRLAKSLIVSGSKPVTSSVYPESEALRAALGPGNAPMGWGRE